MFTDSRHLGDTMFTLLYVPARLRCPVRLLECPDRTSLLRPGGLQHATRYHAAGAGTGFRRLSGGRQNCTSWRLSFGSPNLTGVPPGRLPPLEQPEPAGRYGARASARTLA